MTWPPTTLWKLKDEKRCQQCGIPMHAPKPCTAADMGNFVEQLLVEVGEAEDCRSYADKVIFDLAVDVNAVLAKKAPLTKAPPITARKLAEMVRRLIQEHQDVQPELEAARKDIQIAKRRIDEWCKQIAKQAPSSAKEVPGELASLRRFAKLAFEAMHWLDDQMYDVGRDILKKAVKGAQQEGVDF